MGSRASRSAAVSTPMRPRKNCVTSPPTGILPPMPIGQNQNNKPTSNSRRAGPPCFVPMLPFQPLILMTIPELYPVFPVCQIFRAGGHTAARRSSPRPASSKAGGNLYKAWQDFTRKAGRGGLGPLVFIVHGPFSAWSWNNLSGWTHPTACLAFKLLKVHSSMIRGSVMCTRRCDLDSEWRGSCLF